MRLLFGFVTIALPLLWTSCAREGYADYSQGRPSAATNGKPAFLVINAEPQSGPGQSSNPEIPPSFSVFDEAGRQVIDRAQNRAELLPGKYLIKLEGSDVSSKPFWVSLESGKTTVVDVPRLGKEGQGAIEVR